MYLGYRRVSRVGDRDEQLRSPEQQAERINAAAHREHVDVEMLEPELDVSGDRESREILDAAIARIESGEAEGIIVAKLDRFSRMSLVRALAVLEQIEAVGGHVISYAEPLDPSTPEGEFTRNTFLNVARMQRAQASAGFATSKEDAIARGAWTAPRVPLGYVKPIRGRGLIIDPETAPIVRRIFAMRAAGESWWSITRTLRTDHDLVIDQRRVQKLVQNRAYLGESRQGPYVNPNAHEAIVDRATWEAAQRSAPRPTRHDNARLLLSGLVRCAECGHAMTANTHRNARSYVCSWRVHCPAPAEIVSHRLDPFVTDAILAALRSADPGPATATPVDRNRALQTALGALERAERLLDAYNDPEIQAQLSFPAFVTGLRKRERAVDDAARAVAELRRHVAAVPAVVGVRATEIWPTLTDDERRTVVHDAIRSVIVTRGRGPLDERIEIVPRAA